MEPIMMENNDRRSDSRMDYNNNIYMVYLQGLLVNTTKCINTVPLKWYWG